MTDEIIKFLSKNERISQIKDISYKSEYGGRKYKYLFEFGYSLPDRVIPMIFGVPVNWDVVLMDFYIKDYKEFPYIPHMGDKGLLCLYDIEGVLIGKNFFRVLGQLITRMESVIIDGIEGNNATDFIEEFQSYWGRLPDVKILKSFVKIDTHSKIIKYSDNREFAIKAKNKTYIDCLQRQNNYILFASDTGNEFKFYSERINPQRNGLYIYIKSSTFIFPPDWRCRITHQYVNDLINHPSVSRREITDYLGKCRNQLLLIFGIMQPNASITAFGVYINGLSYLSDEPRIIVNPSTSIIPCTLYRCDREFLLNRGGINHAIEGYRLLVIGCGSIGGYLISELVKTGFTRIDIVDNDFLKEENIYRHLLGMEYVNKYKSVDIYEYLNKNYTGIDIISHVDTIEDLLEDETLSLEDFDIIISAVGSHNVNRWINQYVHKNQIKKPVVYLWNEVLGIGNHVAIFSTEYDGCYECLLSEDDEGIYARPSYCRRGQLFTRRLQGCGSSFLPYSSTNSLTVVVQAVKTIIEFIEGKITDNFLISIKGDEDYMLKAGFTPSDRFFKQKEKVVMIEGKKIYNKACECCNG